MHWQKACSKSKNKIAVRTAEFGRTVMRFKDGSAIIQRFDMGFREASLDEVEGYLDWKPWRNRVA